MITRLRCALDILRGRLPGALAMLKATDIGYLSRSVTRGARTDYWVEVTFYFDSDAKSAADAIDAVQRIYDMEQKKS